MDKGNYKGRALKDLFHYMEPGVFKNAVAALMSSDDESEDNLEHLDDIESDDDDDDDEKTPPRSDLATLPFSEGSVSLYGTWDIQKCSCCTHVIR